MITEEKQLLLKDLSARLPYGVYVDAYSWQKDTPKLLIECVPEYVGEEIVVKGLAGRHSIKEIKPYLRPMSSMTKEEEREVGKLGVCYDGAFHNDIYDVGIYMEEAFTAISWLLERHFDINYLIQKGLALEAPKGMYE